MYLAEAFEVLIAGQGKGRAMRADLVIVCDLNAWRRGHAHGGEPAHIVGGGPLPVSVIKDLGKDAFLKAVIHDGKALHTMAHFGRHIGAELRTALDLGDPPDFQGVKCTGSHCEHRHGLQWDHKNPVANHGETSYDNLGALCRTDHKDKTEQDRQAGLLDGKAKKEGKGEGRDPP